jgi:hypothetical protein
MQDLIEEVNEISKGLDEKFSEQVKTQTKQMIEPLENINLHDQKVLDCVQERLDKEKRKTIASVVHQLKNMQMSDQNCTVGNDCKGCAQFKKKDHTDWQDLETNESCNENEGICKIDGNECRSGLSAHIDKDCKYYEDISKNFVSDIDKQTTNFIRDLNLLINPYNSEEDIAF